MAVLELVGVEKRFGGLPAVDGVSLTVGEREIVALVGPNGAGKSTLLRTVVGLERPTAGTVRFEGRAISGLAPHRIRRAGIAMVLQTPRVFAGMNVRENAAMGAMFGSVGGRLGEAEALDRADEALAFVGLARRADDDVGTLNLHQQRFLELARALAARPRLLLLDEVMAGLNDTELQASIDIVRTARDELGVTVIWVEHVMKAVASLAERVVVLHFGQVLVDGPPEVALHDPDVVAAYLGTPATVAAAETAGAAETGAAATATGAADPAEAGGAAGAAAAGSTGADATATGAADPAEAGGPAGATAAGSTGTGADADGEGDVDSEGEGEGDGEAKGEAGAEGGRTGAGGNGGAGEVVP